MPKSNGRPARVLVVEDQPFVRSAIVRILQAIGFDETEEAETGTEALAAFERSPEGFPIAVVDIFLPDMIAGELAERLPEGHGIEKLILCSGGTKSDFEQARAAFDKRGIAVIHCMKKPMRMEEIRNALI